MALMYKKNRQNEKIHAEVHGEKNIAHAAIKHSRGDSVRVALVRER